MKIRLLPSLAGIYPRVSGSDHLIDRHNPLDGVKIDLWIIWTRPRLDGQALFGLEFRMASDDLKIGREYFCREESTRKEGRFSITENGIQATLFAFDEKFAIPQEKAIHLRLENNKIVSLHESFDVRGGGGHVNSDPPMYSTARTIIANIAVTGHSTWLPQDELWHASFYIPHTDDLLLHSDKFDAIADAKFGTDIDNELLKISAGGMSIQIWYGASGSGNFSRPQKIKPHISIEFDEAQDILSYIRHVSYIVRFFSAALGARLKPSDINIRRLPHDKWLADIEAGNRVSGHSVRYIWPDAKIDNSDLWVGRSFAHVRDDTELAAFSSCLKVWIERDSSWSNATNLMMSAFKLQNVMSAERLLTAFKWFEETPGTGVQSVINDDDLEKIVGVATIEAAKLGYSDLAKRVRGSLKSIKTETHDQRFSRLIAEIRDRFGLEIVPDALLGALNKAVGFRGRNAHGHFEPENEEEYLDFTRSIYALECLCYLLMIKDLPMNAEGRGRVGRSRPVQDLRASLQ